MLSGELKAAASKLQKEQAQRTEKERQRLEKERILAERQRQRQQQREEEARAKRLEVAAAAAAEEERHFRDLEENRGVSLRVQLAAAPASADAASSRGIKRAADKLLLPPSVGASLMSQDAPKNGAMLFEVAASNGGRTHAGVLEFTAPEGVVLLPEKVANCLWGLPGSSDGGGGSSSESRAAYQARAGSPSAAAGPASSSSSSSSRCCGQVWVRYKRLPKGTYVRFQPELRAFHEVVGSDPELLRSTLEQCLLGYCTLSQGDWVQVPYAGESYNLRVLEVQPGGAVSVIDTDIAADVGPSIETEGYLRAQEEEQAREAERQRQAREAAEHEAAQALAAEQAAAEAEARRQAEDAAHRLQIQAQKAALVAPELAADSDVPHLTLLFRLPDGSRLSRRFGLQQHLQELYDFVDSKGAGGLLPGTYQLVLQFPRKVLQAATDQTLTDAGLEAASQQAVLLEPVS
uniref:UBX domain-containing protein n=1 Tax=Tetradesmus obliquus TaxID=3088 RepID=A0A383WIE9_TETOB|eukprot:jgi/Sobl393_1/9508/SZX76526.1